MSQHVITAPATPFWRRRSFVVAALVALLVVSVGAAIGALVSSDSSVTSRSAPAPVEQAVSPVGSVNACAVQPAAGVTLLALIASMPDGAGTRMAGSLSPQALQLIGEAVQSAAILSWGFAPAPDAPTLAAALSRLPTADSAVVINALAPDVQADVGTALSNIASLPTC